MSTTDWPHERSIELARVTQYGYDEWLRALRAIADHPKRNALYDAITDLARQQLAAPSSAAYALLQLLQEAP
jgi:hypothetical protein